MWANINILIVALVAGTSWSVPQRLVARDEYKRPSYGDSNVDGQGAARVKNEYSTFTEEDVDGPTEQDVDPQSEIINEYNISGKESYDEPVSGGGNVETEVNDKDENKDQYGDDSSRPNDVDVEELVSGEDIIEAKNDGDLSSGSTTENPNLEDKPTPNYNDESAATESTASGQGNSEADNKETSGYGSEPVDEKSEAPVSGEGNGGVEKNGYGNETEDKSDDSLSDDGSAGSDNINSDNVYGDDPKNKEIDELASGEGTNETVKNEYGNGNESVAEDPVSGEGNVDLGNTDSYESISDVDSAEETTEPGSGVGSTELGGNASYKDTSATEPYENEDSVSGEGDSGLNSEVSNDSYGDESNENNDLLTGDGISGEGDDHLNEDNSETEAQKPPSGGGNAEENESNKFEEIYGSGLDEDENETESPASGKGSSDPFVTNPDTNETAKDSINNNVLESAPVPGSNTSKDNELTPYEPSKSNSDSNYSGSGSAGSAQSPIYIRKPTKKVPSITDPINSGSGSSRPKQPVFDSYEPAKPVTSNHKPVKTNPTNTRPARSRKPIKSKPSKLGKNDRKPIVIQPIYGQPVQIPNLSIRVPNYGQQECYDTPIRCRAKARRAAREIRRINHHVDHLASLYV